MSAASPVAPRILLVDDAEDTREIYALSLSFEGFRVETAADGSEAIAKCRALLPDIVVLDLGLPAMGGLDVCRQLKDDPRTAAIPVIVLSGRDPATMAPEAKVAGAAAYLFKPCLPETLRDQIARLLDQSSGQ
jgi:CheY-like chemotaxis protein